MYIKTLTQYWWLVALRGGITLLFGIAFVAWPAKSLVVVATLIGLLLLIDGIIHGLVGLFSIKKVSDWWVLLLQGILGVVVGIAIFNYPQFSLGILFFLVALWALLMGIVGLIVAISARKEAYGGWLLAGMSILFLMFGFLLFAQPYNTITVLTVLFGLFAIVSGVMTVALGFELHSMNKDADKAIKSLNS